MLRHCSRSVSGVDTLTTCRGSLPFELVTVRAQGIDRIRGLRCACVIDLVMRCAFGVGNAAQQRHHTGDGAAGVRVVGVVSLVDHCSAVLRVLFHVKVGRSRGQIGSTG